MHKTNKNRNIEKLAKFMRSIYQKKKKRKKKRKEKKNP
jgi:hypothetical protein